MATRARPTAEQQITELKAEVAELRLGLGQSAYLHRHSGRPAREMGYDALADAEDAYEGREVGV